MYRSLNHIYAQVVDDLQGETLAAASTALGKKGERVTGGNVASAKTVGKKIAELAKQKGISKVVFDRGGYIYHGRIKALADAARRSGIAVLGRWSLVVPRPESASAERLTKNDRTGNETSGCQQ